jgi:hypothetical protein
MLKIEFTEDTVTITGFKSPIEPGILARDLADEIPAEVVDSTKKEDGRDG